MKPRQHKKSGSKTVKWRIIVVFAVIAVSLVAVVVWKWKTDPQPTVPTSQSQPADTTKPQGSTASTAQDNTAGGNTQPTLELPYSLEFGKLTVDTAFLLNGINPDCGNAWAENVAAIQFTNNSREHLASVTFFVVIQGGTMVEFAARDIPSGGTAMVFALDNRSVQGQIACLQIACQAVFEAEAPLMEDTVAITVEGNVITVENLTDHDLPQITLYYHDMLERSCYGGSTYQHTIDLLPAGESVTFIAEDCVFGKAEVVRVTQGQ